MLSPEQNTQRLFSINKETELYVHLILSNTFSEPTVKEKTFELAITEILKFNKGVVLDLRDNAYVGKMILAFLVALNYSLHEKQQTIVLMGLKNRVVSLMEWLDLDQEIKVLRSADDIDSVFIRKNE